MTYRLIAAPACCIAAALIVACAPPTTTDGPLPDDDNARTLYFLGTVLNRNIERLELNDDELELVVRGLRESARGDSAELDEDKYQNLLNAMAQKRVDAGVEAEESLAAAYLDTMAAEEGARRTDSGVVIRDIVVGEGEQPGATSTVRAHYHGTLRDGSVFDSSVERGQPFEAPLNGVIPCWTEAIQTMRVGGKSKITCPADRAYGSSGAGSIPGGAALTFEVELLDIVK